jgi:Cohesin domain
MKTLSIFITILLFSICTFAIDVTAPTSTVTVPSSFTVPITADDATGVYSFQFRLAFDPLAIHFDNCSVVGTVADGYSFNCYESPAGTVNTIVYGTQGMSGGGTILNIGFSTGSVTTRGHQCSPLTFSNVHFFDAWAPLSFTTHNGLITLQ